MKLNSKHLLTIRDLTADEARGLVAFFLYL